MTDQLCTAHPKNCEPDMEGFEVDYPLRNGEKNRGKYHKHFAGDRVKSTVEASSFALVSHIIDSQSVFGKLFWTLILIAGVVAFSINLKSLINQLIKGPVLETYKPEGTNFKWPDITICNPANPIAFWKYGEPVTSMWNHLINKSSAYELEISSRIMVPDPLKHLLAMSSLNLSAAHFDDASPMVFEYQIQGPNNVGAKFAGHSTIMDFAYTRMVPYPFQIPCMTLNIAGVNGSKQMLNQSFDVDIVKLYATMDYHSYMLFNYYGSNRMLAVYISAPGQTISKVDHHFGVPGSDVYLRVSMKNVERLPNRGTCVSKPFQIELYDALLLKSRNYTGGYTDCQQYILQRLTVDKCRCYDPTLPIFKSTQVPPRLCLNMSLFSEVEVAENYVCMTGGVDRETKKKAIAAECTAFIHPPCNRLVYSVSHFAIEWPTDISPARTEYLKMLGTAMENSRNNPSVDFLRKNSLFLTVRRNSEMGAVVKEEYSYTFSQFISDFGGIIGLWLSLSLLSLFELIEILWTAIGYLFYHRKKGAS